MDSAWGPTATEWVALTAIATVLTTLVAGVTAGLVLGQLRAPRRQLEAAREAQAEAERPYVVVSVESSESARHLIDLVIQTVGWTPARNVTVRLDPPPVRGREEPGLELDKAKVFTEPIALIPPGSALRVFFDNVRTGRARTSPRPTPPLWPTRTPAARIGRR